MVFTLYSSPGSTLEKNIWRKILASEAFRERCIDVFYPEARVTILWKVYPEHI